MRREHPWVRLLASPANLGFAAGNNLAAKHARGRCLLLLNPDALPAPGALARGIELMDQHADVGLAGGELRGADGSRQPSARMFPTLRDELFTLVRAGRAAIRKADCSRGSTGAGPIPSSRREVDWIPGAFVFIPADVFRGLGGFDERFFMYYEEVDLCRRIRARPAGGSSTGPS